MATLQDYAILSDMFRQNFAPIVEAGQNQVALAEIQARREDRDRIRREDRDRFLYDTAADAARRTGVSFNPNLSGAEAAAQVNAELARRNSPEGRSARAAEQLQGLRQAQANTMQEYSQLVQAANAEAQAAARQMMLRNAVRDGIISADAAQAVTDERSLAQLVSNLSGKNKTALMALHAEAIEAAAPGAVNQAQLQMTLGRMAQIAELEGQLLPELSGSAMEEAFPAPERPPSLEDAIDAFLARGQSSAASPAAAETASPAPANRGFWRTPIRELLPAPPAFEGPRTPELPATSNPFTDFMANPTGASTSIGAYFSKPGAIPSQEQNVQQLIANARDQFRQ